MRRMSFALTTQQVRDRRKWVTRRLGWNFVREGDLLLPVERAMGLRKGEKAVVLENPIAVMGTRWEPLEAIRENPKDVLLEGFPGRDPEWFIDFFLSHISKAKRRSDIPVNRIHFSYTDPNPFLFHG